MFLHDSCLEQQSAVHLDRLCTGFVTVFTTLLPLNMGASCPLPFSPSILTVWLVYTDFMIVVLNTTFALEYGFFGKTILGVNKIRPISSPLLLVQREYTRCLLSQVCQCLFRYCTFCIKILPYHFFSL